MSEMRGSQVVIVGAGPAGCALACMLRLRGLGVTVFDNGVRPELIVGESLIPAAIPLLEKLGIEDDVAAMSTRKPGASLFHRNGVRVDFKFRKFWFRAPDYAYNIPRPAFDELLQRKAHDLGVRFINQAAKVEPVLSDGPGQAVGLRLSKDSALAAGIAPTGVAPLLIDATGRTRLFSRLMKIPVVRGARDDVAYFAHFKHFDHDDVAPGQVIISILNHGWSWRIPLKEGLSVGVVLDRTKARQFGDSAEERLINIIKNEPLLATKATRAVRTSAVKTYSNYQQLTETGFGPGWVMAGDAFGFVDPMLSPGVFMALESASLLSEAVDKHLRSGGNQHLQVYSDKMNEWHSSWSEAIEYLYDGRLMFLAESGRAAKEEAGPISMGPVLDWYYRRVVALIISGVGTRSQWQRTMLARAATHFLERKTDDKEDEKYYAVLDA